MVPDIKASFLAISTLGDILEVITKILTMKRSSLILVQEVWKKEVKVLSMEVIFVYVDEGKPCRILEEFEDIFKSILC